MPERKTLHVFNNEIKFSRTFFEYLGARGWNLERHTLIQYSSPDPAYQQLGMKASFTSLFSPAGNLKLLFQMFRHERIVIHNLASPWLLIYLFLFPSLYPRVFWIVWGKDLYFYQLLDRKRFYHKIYEFFRRHVFRRIQHISAIEGDYRLAQRWYGVTAKCYVSFMYPSNLFKNMELPEKTGSTTVIQLGNSADPSNTHLQILDELAQFRDEDIQVVVPLAYGDRKHAKKVVASGRSLFGKKFRPLLEFMPFDEYLALLASVDIAIFNHPRTQGNGNAISLLGFGKKVYMRRNVSMWREFENREIKVFDIADGIHLSPLDQNTKAQNIANTRKHFCEQNYLDSLLPIVKKYNDRKDGSA